MYLLYSQFFQDVASYSAVNKMDVKNLAIVITPSVMPVEEKIVVNSSSRLSHHVQAIEVSTCCTNYVRCGLHGYPNCHHSDIIATYMIGFFHDF